MEIVTGELAAAARPRAYVGARGPQAEDYLQRILSNDVAALAPGTSCEALLLTAKARVIAPLVVLRRGADDYLLATEPELGETVRDHLLRSRFAARVELQLEQHDSTLVLGLERPPEGALGFRNEDYGVAAVELLDRAAPADARPIGEEELEVLRIEAGRPRYGREIDERVLPAEAGLVERSVSLTKGCYPGQEPIARLHFRGHANRGLRVLRIEGGELPEAGAEIRFGDKPVGRVTSAARKDGGVVALAYVRAEVPQDAELAVGPAIARPLN